MGVRLYWQILILITWLCFLWNTYTRFLRDRPEFKGDKEVVLMSGRAAPEASHSTVWMFLELFFSWCCYFTDLFLQMITYWRSEFTECWNTGPFPCCVCSHRFSLLSHSLLLCELHHAYYTQWIPYYCVNVMLTVSLKLCAIFGIIISLTVSRPVTSLKNCVRWESKLISLFQLPPWRLEVTVTRLFISSTRLHRDIKWDISVLFMIRESYWDSEITICW